MNKRRWIILIAGLLVFGVIPTTAAAQAADSPGAAVNGYYDWYLGYIMGSGEFRNPLIDGAYRDSEYLTRGLIVRIDERLATAGDMGLGYDLFLCAQDLPEKYSYEVIDLQATEALVLLREYFGANPRSSNLTLTLNNAEGPWKINDVVCGDTLTPRGVAQDFYTWYLGQWRQARDSITGGNPLIENSYRQYLFLTEALIVTVDEEVANRELGSGDPFLCAQDIPQSFWAHDVGMEGSEATVLVQSFFPGNPTPHNLTVNMELTDNQWRIAQIICGAAPETVAGLLYRQYADQVRYHLENNIEGDILRNPMPHWNRNVHPALMARLADESERELIADPVLCAQDIPERFKAEQIASSPTEVTVKISGEYPSGPDTYTPYPLAVVTMELDDGQWILTDISCSR